MRTGLIAALLVVLALAWFNPDMDDFRRFVQQQSSGIILDQTGDTSLGRALSDLGSGLAAAYIDRVTTRRNYLLFSSYTVSLAGDDSDQEWRFLGMAAHLFETKRPEALREE